MRTKSPKYYHASIRLKKYFIAKNTTKYCQSLIVVLFCCLNITTNAQYGTKAEVRNVEFRMANDKVLIQYDLIKAKRHELFDINVDIFNSSGFEINASTFTGQFNNVHKGRNKSIEWHLGEDYASFEDNIFVEITAKHTNYKFVKRVSKFEALCKSTLWPGWGSAQTQLKKRYYSRGLFAYGFVAGGLILYYEQSHTTPGGLHNEKARYNDTDEFEALAYGCFATAGIIWLLDYSKILFNPNISKNIELDVQSRLHTFSPELALKYRF